MKTIYYYQTFVGLHKLMSHAQDIDVINVSSIHFNKDSSGNPQIYLNGNVPYDKKFNDLWMDTEHLYNQGVTIMLMVGGAGGAYTELFRDFKSYYPLLKQLLSKKTFIGGVDIDVEESVDVNHIKMLIRLLKQDFPHFKISMAPISASMTSDGPGMGGFSYKRLYQSYEERLIDWFNVQAYGNFNFETYDKIIKNNYNPENIVFGMISGDFLNDNFHVALKEIELIKEKYPNMAGCDVWEMINAPPDIDDPSKWALLLKN